MSTFWGAHQYLGFTESLGLADALLKIESRYADPAPMKNRKIVEGLRGGATVLMVAAFENFLKELIEEHFDELTRIPLRFKAEHVPSDMIFYNLEFLVTSSTKVKKDIKVNCYNDMAAAIVSGIISPHSFTDAVRSNPNAEKLKELFKRLGIKDCYAVLKKDFDTALLYESLF